MEKHVTLKAAACALDITEYRLPTDSWHVTSARTWEIHTWSKQFVTFRPDLLLLLRYISRYWLSVFSFKSLLRKLNIMSPIFLQKKNKSLVFSVNSVKRQPRQKCRVRFVQTLHLSRTGGTKAGAALTTFQQLGLERRSVGKAPAVQVWGKLNYNSGVPISRIHTELVPLYPVLLKWDRSRGRESPQAAGPPADYTPRPRGRWELTPEVLGPTCVLKVHTSKLFFLADNLPFSTNLYSHLPHKHWEHILIPAL